jgi:hypothetical protein
MTLEEARQLVPPALASLERTRAGVVLRTNIQDIDWMARFLAGLDCSFAVREPDELREALRRHAERLAKLAARSESEGRQPLAPGGVGELGHASRPSKERAQST